MSKVVTPPDIVREKPVYLIVNAPIADVEMISRWLQITKKDYTIHLYHDGMQDTKWLGQVGSECDGILVSKTNSNSDTIQPIFSHVAKIIWFGKDESYRTALDYFVEHGRN